MKLKLGRNVEYNTITLAGIVYLINSFGSIPDVGILLRLTPDDFTHQAEGDLLDRKGLKHSVIVVTDSEVLNDYQTILNLEK